MPVQRPSVKALSSWSDTRKLARCLVGALLAGAAVSAMATQTFLVRIPLDPKPRSTAPAETLGPGGLRMSGGVFGSIDIHETVDKTVRLTNSGEQELPLADFVLNGEAFEVVDSTCSTALAVNESCEMWVRFAPLASGAYSGSLAVETPAGLTTHALSGRGEGLEVEPLASNFFDCAGFGWGITPEGAVQCNIFVPQFHTATLPAQAEPSRLLTLTGEEPFYPYQNVSCAWYKKDTWNYRHLRDSGQLHVSSSHRKYSFNACSTASRDEYSYVRSARPMLIVLNTDGTVLRTIAHGAYLDRADPYQQQSAAVDEARGVAWMPSYIAGQNYRENLIQVDLNTGAVLKTIPNAMAIFAYDHAQGELYFVPGSDYYGTVNPPQSYLVRYNPATGSTVSVSLSRPVNFWATGMSMVAWNGKLLVHAQGESALLEIDTSVSPAKVKTVTSGATTVGRYRLLLAQDGWAYSEGYRVRVKLR